MERGSAAAAGAAAGTGVGAGVGAVGGAVGFPAGDSGKASVDTEDSEEEGGRKMLPKLVFL